MVDGNPADLVSIKKLLPNDYSEERSRILSPKEILTLNSAINNLKDNYSKSKKKYDIERPLKEETSIAIWICLSTLCRIGELMKAEWKDIDFKKNVWFIPLSNSKGTSGKKQDQYVYLSNFAVKYFKDLKELTGQSKWLFPATNNESNLSEKTMSKQIGDRQIKFKNRLKNHNAKLLIGICWRSETLSASRNSEYTSISDWGPIFSIPNACFVNLQYGECEEEIQQAEEKFNIKILRWNDIDLKMDIDDVMSLIDCLDIVITAGTAVFAMAGSIRKETYLYISKPGWDLLGTDYYPWFDTVKVFYPSAGEITALTLSVISNEIMHKKGL